ncbi:MAG TPA: maleylpyruvate isomerase family mycothiol-dependent enzyme [Acidimicrobiia bacterium]|nr:maleylpyruvate isomerase family mycothiol-dependent enzyme [Acidimicrobiia bacterium]
MDTTGYLDGIRSNVALFLEAARSAGAGAPVPTCPEWDVATLAVHQGRIFRWAAALVDGGSQEFIHPKTVGDVGPGEDPIDWLEAGAARVLDVLGKADPDAPVWNWADQAPGPARFWIRRMAHEVTIHRADAEAAASRANPVEPAELASDGIDEFVHLIAARTRDGRVTAPTGSYHFHTTDVEGEWVVRVDDGGYTVTREHAKADVAVRGPASALELYLYNRRGSDGLEIFGAPEQVAAWSERVRF